ncbi:type II secretion system F family protein [Candidatus Nomurabacteria bacterium]|nr:type II secretion system F family protein [Candidatus Nomurabacteria bacterium]
MNKNKKNFDIPKKKYSKNRSLEIFTKNNSWVNFKPHLLKIKIPKLDFSAFVNFSIKKQTFFAKRLAFLIKAGVPMLESISLMQKQTKSKLEIKIFDQIIFDISNGQSLAISLGRFPRVFGNFTINIIKAGETSGTLTQNLNYLADELKKKEILRRKIIGSLLYPLIVTIATFGITLFLIVYIFPKITPIFQSLKAELPISTRTIMYLTNILRSDWEYILGGTFIFFVFFFVAIKYFPKVRFIYDGLILRLPLMGAIIKSYNLANITRTLGLLLKSGLSLTESLLVTADTTENTQYKKVLINTSKNIAKGKSVSILMESYPALFPTILPSMLEIGERSGNLSNTLIYLSEYYEHDFDDITKNLSSTIEPVLMILMGIMVGFVAISVITPIYEITNNLKR